MAMSSKKITYTSDFKLKVLDYYFKNGGDDNFGLKKKTAQHFNIDKKTISRMLNNPDMVKRARKLLARKVTTTPKNTPNTRQGAAKTSAKATKVAAAKVSVANTSGKVSASSHTSASNNNSNNSSSSYKASTSSASSTKHAGGSSGSNQGNSSSQPSAKSAASKNKCGDQEGDNGIQVFDLPEDPDYSILKKSINASANGVANLAKLLVTGTKEVQNLILNECDVILECKVCNNLFRSVVNFLAHKRIYCQEEYADVRSLFHKDNVQGITSHSRTVVVEPEPPPDTPQHLQPDPSTSASNTLTVPVRSGAQRSERRSGIDSIARRLANKRKQHSLSSSTYTGSSDYYQRISEINNKRDKLSRDCSVVLEDIGGVANAMYQTYVPPSKPSPVSTIRNLIDEVSEHEKGLTVAINENGDIMKTAAGNVTNMEVEQTPSNADVSKEIICRLCNTRFATQKTLSVHQRTQHGYERNIYCCPICQTTFLNILSVVKHLQKVHKKTKTQIERLRKVIKKNMYKKMVYQRDEFKDQEDLDRSNDKAELEKEEEEEEGEEEEEEEEEEQEQDQNQAEEEEREVAEGEENATCEQPAKMEVDSNPQKGNSANTTPKNSPVKSTLKGSRSKEGVRWMCNVCLKKFISRPASLAHVATHIICNFEPKAVLIHVDRDGQILPNQVTGLETLERNQHSRIRRNSFEDDNDEEMEAEEEEEEEEEEEDNNNEDEDVDVERVDDVEEDDNEVDKVHFSNKSQFQREVKTVEQSHIIGRRKNRKGVARKIKPESVVYETENETLLRLQGASCSSSEDEKEVRKIHSSKIISPVKIEKVDSLHVSSYSKGKKQGKINTSEGKKIKTVTSSKENKTMNIKQQKVVQNQYLSKTEPAGKNKSKENSLKTDLTVQPSTSTYEGSTTNSSMKKPELKSTDYLRNQSSPLRASWKDHSEEEVHKVATQLRLFEEDWSRSESSTSDSEGEEDQLDERNSNEGGENSEPEQGSSLEIDVVPSMRAKSKCTYKVKNIDNLLERSQDAIDIICEKNYLAESRLNREKKVIPVPPLGETCLPAPRNASEDQGSERIRSPTQEEEEVMPRLTAIWANEDDTMSEKDILSKGESKEPGVPSYSLSQTKIKEFKVKAEEEKGEVEKEPSTVVEEVHKKMVTKPGCELDREEGTNKDKITIKEEITLKEEPLIEEDQVQLFQVRVMVSEEDIKKEYESESPKKTNEGTDMETVVISDDADVAERHVSSAGGWSLLGLDLPVDEVIVEDVMDEIEKQVEDGESVTGLGSSCKVPVSVIQTNVTSMSSKADTTKLASASVLLSKAHYLCEKSDGTSKPQTETPKVKDGTSSQVKAPEMSGKSEKLGVSTSTDRKPFKTVTLVRPKHISASGSRSNVPFFSKCRNTFPVSKTNESEVASVSQEVCADSVSLPSTSTELTSPLIASVSQTKPCPAPAISPILAKNPEIDKVCKPLETVASSTKSSKSHQEGNKTDSKTKLAGDSPYTKIDLASREQIQVSSGCPHQLKMPKEATSPTSPCAIAPSISTLQTHVTSTPIQVISASAASGWEKKSDQVPITQSVTSLIIQQMSEKERSYKPNLDIKTRSVQNVSGPRKSGFITISKATKNVSPSTEAENVKGTELQAHFSGSDTQDKSGKSVSRCSLQSDSLAQKILTVKSAELVVSRKGKDIVVTRKSNLESLQTTGDKMHKRKQEEQLDSETTQAAGEKLTESESKGRHDAKSLSQERDRDSLKLKIKDLAPEECAAVKTLVGISESTKKRVSVSSSIGESHLTLKKPLDHRKSKLREESHSDASPSCSMPHRDIQTSVLKEEEGNKVSSEADVSKLPALVKNVSKIKVQDEGNKSENISISWTRQRPEEIKQYGGKMKEEYIKYKKRIRQNQDERQNVPLEKSKEEESARGREIDLPVVAGEDAGVDLVQPHNFKLFSMREEEEHPLEGEEMFRKNRHKEKKKDQNKKLWQMVMAAKARAKKEVEKKDSDTPSDGDQGIAGDAGVSAEELAKDHVLTLWSGESKETSTKRERGSADHQGSEHEEKPFYVKRAKMTQCAGEENKADEIRKVVPGVDQLKSSSANTSWRIPDDAGMSSSERTLIPKEKEVVSLESEASESQDPVSAAEVDLMTTLDQNAVMRDATTFGDLSYDYDLQ
ncbi:uncharacterized protein LOC125037050 isoform X1 [Penaeus chinensis]|uniref:uncharacterized protein LOC125037050 isoform X1 n=1 Tax=Penaeus chinensis TaxID=139456 RepID=UPI001FB7C2F6|nr:uncharacterized protein LOC125037050 isoform X1 [Penaeus chinensis]